MSAATFRPLAAEPPLDAERSVLAAMVLDRACIGPAQTLLKASDFCSVTHARIFEAIVALHGRDGAVDTITVTEELRRRGDLEVVDGPAEIARVLECAGTSANVEAHCEIIREGAAERSLHRLGLELQDRNGAGPVSDAISFIHGRLDEIEQLATPRSAKNLVGLDLDGEIEPLAWLLKDWLVEQDVGLFCGQAGEGKTTLLAALALSLSGGVPPWEGGPVPTRRAPVVYLDAEMGSRSTRRVFKRLMAGMGLARKPESLLVVSAPGELSLVSAEALQRIEAMIVDLSKRHESLGSPVVLFDTLSAALAGLESFNDAALIEPVYRTLFRWRDQFGCTTLLSHHPRKRGRWETRTPTLDQVRDTTTHVAKCSVAWFAQRPARTASCLDVYTLKHRDRDPIPVQRVGYRSNGNDQLIRLHMEEARQPEVEGEGERVRNLIVDFVRQRGRVKAAEVVDFAKSQKIAERTTDRTLSSLVRLQVLTQTTPDGKKCRGWYWLVNARPEWFDKADDEAGVGDV